jgi:hypothetical protein
MTEPPARLSLRLRLRLVSVTASDKMPGENRHLPMASFAVPKARTAVYSKFLVR